MTDLQPALVTPLVAPDPRLIQYARFSVSHEYTSSHAETVSYGNCRGAGVIVARRFEFDWMPPPYIQHNRRLVADGAGDTSLIAKFRIASGNKENGNFDIAAMVSKTFATGSYKNGAPTGSFTPTLVGGYAFGRFGVISGLGAVLPTGKVAQQGRTILWNTTLQFHATRHIWFEAEDNATFYRGGSHDGEMQNLATPAAFFVFRRKDWKPTHPFVIVNGGMQIATSGFHTYNHNTITEIRVLF